MHGNIKRLRSIWRTDSPLHPQPAPRQPVLRSFGTSTTFRLALPASCPSS